MYFDIRVYMNKYDYVMSFHLIVMLRSTTGSYGRPVIEVAYEEMIFHSTEAVWDMVAREEWLGYYRYDASPMFDIPRSTPVWAQCMVFFDFINIKVYMYYVSKTYMYYERNIGGL